jgi:hypothetical protein
VYRRSYLLAWLLACMHVCLLLLTLVELSLTHFLDCVDDGSAGRLRLSCAVLFPSSIRSSSSTWMFWNSMVVSWGVVDSTTSAIVVSCSAGHYQERQTNITDKQARNRTEGTDPILDQTTLQQTHSSTALSVTTRSKKLTR